MLDIRRITIGTWQINCYSISDETGRCVLIDPGENPVAIDEEIIQRHGFKLVAMLATHGHLDHVGGARFFTEKYAIPLHVHPDDTELALQATYWAGVLGTPGILDPKIVQPLPEGVVNIQGFEFKIIHTPGHTLGGICIYLREKASVFTGDTLFFQAIGRSDRPGLDTGGQNMLIDSIRSRLFLLPGNTTVFPGHGKSTTIDAERQWNPYLTMNDC